MADIKDPIALAEWYGEQGDLIKQEEILLQAASDTTYDANVYAAVNLGSYYRDNKNLSKAKFWYKEAASKGNIPAVHLLGDLVVPEAEAAVANEDLQVAKSLYLEVVQWKYKHPYALMQLGFLEDRTQNHEEAEKWFTLAYTHPEQNASYLPTIAYCLGIATAKDRDRSQVWFSRSAELGDSEAAYILGFRAEQDGDYNQAVVWHKMAAEQGHAKSAESLAKIPQGSLDSAPPLACLEFLEALKSARAGEVSKASSLLGQLNKQQLLLGTFIIEIVAVEAGIEPEKIARIGISLHEIPEDELTLWQIPLSLKKIWAKLVGPILPLPLLLRRDRFGYHQPLLTYTIEALCEAGTFDQAYRCAEEFTDYHRDSPTKSWLQVGFGFSKDHPKHTEALLRAARVGNLRQIENGGEEASALGIVIESLAENGIDAEHPAVALALQGLKKIEPQEWQSEQRSPGAEVACVAAALRSYRDQDTAWLAVAKELKRLIWSEKLKVRPEAAISLASKTVPLSDEKEVLDSVINPESPRRELELLKKQVAAGELTEEQIREAIHQSKSFNYGGSTKKISQFILACVLELSQNHIDNYLEAVPPSSRSEALFRAAFHADAVEQEKRREWLERGFPEGDPSGRLSVDFLPWLTDDKLLEGEHFYVEAGKTEALSNLVCFYSQAGRVDDASRTMANIKPKASRKSRKRESSKVKPQKVTAFSEDQELKFRRIVDLFLPKLPSDWTTLKLSFGPVIVKSVYIETASKPMKAQLSNEKWEQLEQRTSDLVASFGDPKIEVNEYRIRIAKTEGISIEIQRINKKLDLQRFRFSYRV